MKIHRNLPRFIASCLLWAGGAAALLAADTAAPAAGGNTTAANATTNNAASLLQSTNYKLRPLDVITVRVVQDDKATSDYKIDVDGKVQLTYLPDHPVKVANLSTSDAANLIIKTYIEQGIFVNPSINVSVKEFAPRYFKFIGQVAKPGLIEIPPSQEMTLSQALGLAGGPLPNAARYVNIARVNPDGTTTTLPTVDLWEAVHNAKKDIPIQEGDTITLGQSMLGDVWHD